MRCLGTHLGPVVTDTSINGPGIIEWPWVISDDTNIVNSACTCFHLRVHRNNLLLYIFHIFEDRAAGVRPVLPDPSESSNEVGSWLPPRPEEQVGRAPGGAALRGGVGGTGEAAAPIQVRPTLLSRFAL